MLAAKIGGIVLSAICVALGCCLAHLWNVIEPPAAAIIQEYWAHHPDAKSQPSDPIGMTVAPYTKSSNTIGLSLNNLGDRDDTHPSDPIQ